MSDWRIGMIVEITGKVTKIKGGTTSLFSSKLNKPVKVMVLGKAYLYTGTLTGGHIGVYEYEPAYLTSIKSHAVWMVMPLAGDRYRKPIAVFEEQIRFKGGRLEDEN